MRKMLNGVLGLILAALVLMILLPRIDRGQAINNGAPGFTQGIDPCGSTGYQKSNVSISIASATTTQVIALSAGKVVYVCDWTFTINSSATTAATVAFEYGTGTTCGTGTTALTGAMGTENAAAGAGILLVNGPAAGESFQTPVSNALCLLTAGTTVNLQGQITYVQM